MPQTRVSRVILRRARRASRVRPRLQVRHGALGRIGLGGQRPHRVVQVRRPSGQFSCALGRCLGGRLRHFWEPAGEVALHPLSRVYRHVHRQGRRYPFRRSRRPSRECRLVPLRRSPRCPRSSRSSRRPHRSRSGGTQCPRCSSSRRPRSSSSQRLGSRSSSRRPHSSSSRRPRSSRSSSRRPRSSRGSVLADGDGGVAGPGLRHKN